MDHRPQNNDRWPLKGNLILWILMVLAVPACAHLPTDADRSSRQPSLAASLMEMYQGPLNHLRAVRAGECPMTPSCSEYCRQAMEKHGFLLGWLMSVDRLLRCGRDELASAPQVFIDGKRKAYDPVENNDFWWDPHPLRVTTKIKYTRLRRIWVHFQGTSMGACSKYVTLDATRKTDP